MSNSNPETPDLLQDLELEQLDFSSFTEDEQVGLYPRRTEVSVS
jgi:hypothetical protein